MSAGKKIDVDNETLVRLDTGLFPNIKADAGSQLALRDDGSRCVVNANGEVVYLNGPDTAAEAYRLGLEVGMVVSRRSSAAGSPLDDRPGASGRSAWVDRNPR